MTHYILDHVRSYGLHIDYPEECSNLSSIPIELKVEVSNNHPIILKLPDWLSEYESYPLKYISTETPQQLMVYFENFTTEPMGIGFEMAKKRILFIKQDSHYAYWVLSTEEVSDASTLIWNEDRTAFDVSLTLMTYIKDPVYNEVYKFEGNYSYQDHLKRLETIAKLY